MAEIPNKWRRREFVKKSSLAGFSILTTPHPLLMHKKAPGYSDGKSNLLQVSPRYHRWHVDPGVEWLESNTRYNHLDWNIAISDTALVLVDVWQRHYLKDTERRSEKIITQNLLPLLESCRKNGMKIIHAPSPTVARKFKSEEVDIQRQPTSIGQRPWPPKAFRSKSGKYQEYARPEEPREKERQSLPPLTIHPKVIPLKDETIVASGQELHDLCRQEGILFLFFAGFNTNACMITRDYGALEMSKYGYEIVIVRDCTTGMESAKTHDSLDQTNNAILFFEMFGQYSIESREIVNGFTSKK